VFEASDLLDFMEAIDVCATIQSHNPSIRVLKLLLPVTMSIRDGDSPWVRGSSFT
jgi:hypothetical protein